MPPRRKNAATTTAAAAEDSTLNTTKRQRHDDAKEDVDDDTTIGPPKTMPILDQTRKCPFTPQELVNGRKALKRCDTVVKQEPLHNTKSCRNANECCSAPIMHSRSSTTRVESVIHADGTGSAHIHSQREVDGVCVENKDVDITRNSSGHIVRQEHDCLEHKADHTAAIQHKQ